MESGASKEATEGGSEAGGRRAVCASRRLRERGLSWRQGSAARAGFGSEGRGRQRGQGSAARAGALQELMPQALQEAHLRAVSRRWWGMVPWDGGVNGRLGSKDWNEDCCHGICLLM